MSIVNKKVPVEVVVREKTVTEYVCDGCEAIYEIGQFNHPEAINSLHPPRSWWAVRPADGADMHAERRERHACSTICLRKVTNLIAAEVIA